MKIERTRIHFFSDVFSAVAVLGSWGPYDNGDGSENVTFKINSSFFKLCRVYFNSLKKSNVGAFPWSWFLGDRLKFFKFRKRKKNSPLSLPSLVFVLHETWNFETLCKRSQQLAAAALGKLTGLVFEIPGKKFFKTVTCLKEFNQVNFFYCWPTAANIVQCCWIWLA